MNDTRIERERQTEQQQRADSALDRDTDCSAALLLTTTTVDAYPATAAAFYACFPTEINGDETEGGAATYVFDTSTILYALNVGTQIPASGTRVVAHAVGGRFVFRYDG